MNKSFYIFYLCPFLISSSLFAQEVSRSVKKQKDTEKQPLLMHQDDDDPGAAPGAYHVEPLPLQTADHNTQQPSTAQQRTPRYLNLERIGVGVQPVTTTNNTGAVKLEKESADFDHPGIALQHVTYVADSSFAPSADHSSYTATSHTTQFNPYSSEQIAAAQQEKPIEYGQPISNNTPQVTTLAVQPFASSIDSSSCNTSSRSMWFNPFAETQEQITTAQSTVQQEKPVEHGQSARAQQVASYAAQSTMQAQPIASSTSQQHITPPAEQLCLPPEYMAKSNTLLDESVKIKKQAHTALVVLIDTYYTEIESDEKCDKIRNALMVEIKRLRKLLPYEQNIDRWFLNLPVDTYGHTMAHTAAANLDAKLLQMLHMMGVDIFKPNNFNTFPEDSAKEHLVEKANLTDAQKKLLIPEAVVQENTSGRRRVRKASGVASTSTVISVEEQKKQRQYDIEVRDQTRKYYEKQRKTRYERHKKVIAYFDKVRNKK